VVARDGKVVRTSMNQRLLNRKDKHTSVQRQAAVLRNSTSAHVSLGSNPEMLAASTCFLLCIQ
jgi:hypothetical protein